MYLDIHSCPFYDILSSLLPITAYHKLGKIYKSGNLLFIFLMKFQHFFIFSGPLNILPWFNQFFIESPRDPPFTYWRDKWHINFEISLTCWDLVLLPVYWRSPNHGASIKWICKFGDVQKGSNLRTSFTKTKYD